MKASGAKAFKSTAIVTPKKFMDLLLPQIARFIR
jgi:hypothetical protein